MQLTEIRINLCPGTGGRLKAFCSLTFDRTFVVRDVKLIDGHDGVDAPLVHEPHVNGNGSALNGHANGNRRMFMPAHEPRLFVAMPSRKLCDHCERCSEKNHLRARFCNHCGTRLNENRHLRYRPASGSSRLKLHADIAHPITPECRATIERQVLDAYRREVERSKLPGYIAPNLDGEDGDLSDLAPVPARAVV